MTARAPESLEACSLQNRVTLPRWAVLVAEARARAVIFDAVVVLEAKTGTSMRSSLKSVSPGTPWPTFVKGQRRQRQRSGPTWERRLDESTPPPPKALIPEEVVRATCGLRRGDRCMSTAQARAHLAAVFGEAGDLSDASLRRIWKAANLQNVRGRMRGAGRSGSVAASVVPAEAEASAVDEEEEDEDLSGGGGRALVAAAEAELGAMQALAECALAVGQAHADAQVHGADAGDDAEGRDEDGKFTGEYNVRRRGDTPVGQTDSRWVSDAQQAAARPLGTLQTLARDAGPLARRNLAMGATPLFVNSHGFDGMSAPAGAWLGALGAVAYLPATLDKSLAELALLDVEDALWREHARQWQSVSRRWSEPGQGWLQTTVYVDGTADPYWTHGFAKSGKVSRVGRVMPFLSRIAVNSGAGVPLLVETHAGAVSLKNRLLPMLAELEAAIGPKAAARRLTVVDSEAGTAGMMWAMHEHGKMNLIKVIKGQVLAGAKVHDAQPWQRYRDRDEVREVLVDVRGRGIPEESLMFRGVEMRRGDGRHPHVTLFATNAHADDLPTVQLVDDTLARWPRQEQLFRQARNGGGLSRSHGFGGGDVHHVALAKKRQTADRARDAARAKLDRAEAQRQELAAALAKVHARAHLRARPWPRQHHDVLEADGDGTR